MLFLTLKISFHDKTLNNYLNSRIKRYFNINFDMIPKIIKVNRLININRDEKKKS